MKNGVQRAELLDRLAETGDRLAIIKDGSVLFTSREPGIQPLLEAIHSISAAELRDSQVADTVVGKAGALLMAHAEVAFVAGRVMSTIGTDTLRAHRIPFHAKTVVPAILGRHANRQCPFEKAVAGINDPHRALDVLTELTQSLASKAPQPRVQ